MMKFIVTRISDNNYLEIKQFSTLEDFIKFKNQCKYPITINRNFWFNKNVEYVKDYFPSNIDIKELVTILYSIEIDDG